MVTKDFNIFFFFPTSDLTRLISVFVLIMMKGIYFNFKYLTEKKERKKQVRLRGTMNVFGILSAVIGVIIENNRKAATADCNLGVHQNI